VISDVVIQLKYIVASQKPLYSRISFAMSKATHPKWEMVNIQGRKHLKNDSLSMKNISYLIVLKSYS
jgi:hypothetical protein